MEENGGTAIGNIGIAQKKHFVLVHGACHGAWCWYKLATILREAGYRVTTIDLAASGIHPSRINEDVRTFEDYSQPLMEMMALIPSQDKIILVGHSLGGLNLALAMEHFPHKVSVAVFLAAFMPDSSSSPSYVLDKYLEKVTYNAFSDTLFKLGGGSEVPLTTMLFGHKFLSEKLYQHSPLEDLALAKTLVRTSSLFIEDMSKAPKFSEERYGSIPRVYIICDEDLGIPQDFQRWMVDNYPVNQVIEIKGSDHMPMFSKSRELFHALVAIDTTCYATVEQRSMPLFF